MPKLDNGMVVPYTFEKQGLSPNNPTVGAVVVAMLQTGQDPLQGTGLTYGENLMYDVSGTAVEGTASMPVGSPAVPNEIPYTPSNPEPGK
jgi:hypothetical protein